MHLLDDWKPGSLGSLAFGLVGGAIWVRMQPGTLGRLSYQSSRLWLMGAFLSNFLLFGVMGGLLEESVRHPSPNQAVMGLRRVVMRSDTLVQPERVKSDQADYYAERQARSGNQTGRRIGFILLFVLSYLLIYVAAVLACTLACSGYGVAAVLVLLLGFGAQLGGVFFLSRAFEKIVKPWREMDRSERRRVNRRMLLILLALWAFILLTGAIL